MADVNLDYELVGELHGRIIRLEAVRHRQRDEIAGLEHENARLEAHITHLIQMFSISRAAFLDAAAEDQDDHE